MSTPNTVWMQLKSLKLSDGARVVESTTRPESSPASATNMLKAFMAEHQISGTTLRQADVVGSGGEAKTTKVHHTGGSGADNSNNNTGSSGGGGNGGAKSVRILRATPRSQQQQHQQQHLGGTWEEGNAATTQSSTLEQLRRAFPTTTISAAPESAPTLPPVVIAPLDVEPSAVRVSTVVAGDATSPKLLGPIDNLNAQKPIICTAPPCKGRYIIVGDIHGCPKQLEELMSKLNYQRGEDCLILAGDLVNKGPDSIGAVQLAQKLGAIGVLGNHDNTLLNCISRYRKRQLPQQEEFDPVMRLAASFPQECEDYLRSLPHILRVPKYNVLVVHAGLNMNHSIEDQDVHEIMHMRRLEKLGDDDKKPRSKPKWRAVIKGSRGEPWGKMWTGPECVVFGHDARSGLQKHPFAYGIDTGCVYGDKLTCLVYGPDSPQGTLVSVPGLPKFTNEKQGLPPPAAAIYEQCIEDLERRILRPTSRATPCVGTGLSDFKPTFLSAPPTGASPTARSPPPVSAGVGSSEKWSSKRCGVEQITLLALSKAGELRSVNTLMCLPVYEAAWLSWLHSDADECARAFWIPFVEGVLEALLRAPAESVADCADDVLQLALEACDEVEAVRRHLASQLRSLAAREVAGSLAVSKATAKLLRSLAAS